MQRTRQSVQPLTRPTDDAGLSVGSALFSTASRDVAYALFAPMHYTSGYKYPLIVWLHGPAQDERQLVRIMPQVSTQNYVGVAPRGICLAAASPDRQECGWDQTDDEIQQAEQRVFDCIEIASQELHVSRQRIFLAGFDCGGTMAFRLAMNRPERFAGVLSLCGRFPTGRPLLGNLVAARRVPTFLAVGRYSRDYPADEVCENLRLLHSAGMSVTLRQYPCGHELSLEMLADANRWIMEQIEAQRQAATLDASR